MKKNKKRFKQGTILFCFLFFLFILGVMNFAAAETGAVNAETALQAINKSEIFISEMDTAGFSVEYVNDLLIQANRVFAQAGYAGILRTEKENLTLIKEAETALKLVDWKNIDYSSVLVYTDGIEAWYIQSFDLYDKIKLAEVKVNEFSKNYDVTEAGTILNKAKEEFYADRFENAYKLLDDLELSLEKQQSQANLINSFTSASKNFFQNFWKEIIVFFILFVFIFIFVYTYINRYFLRKKIQNLKIELDVLIDLIKKVQTERFTEDKISGLVYNIKMKKYNERINHINEYLPVLEEKLKRKKKGIFGLFNSFE